MKYIYSNETPNQPKPTEPAGMGLIWAWEPNSNMWIRVKEDEAVSTVKQPNQPSYTTQQNATSMYTSATLTNKFISSLEQKLVALVDKKYINKADADESLKRANFIEYAGYDLKFGPQYKISAAGLKFLQNYNLNLARTDVKDIIASKETQIEIKQISDIEPIEKEVERNYASQKRSLVINFKDKIEAKLAKDVLAINRFNVKQKENQLTLQANKITASLKQEIKTLLNNEGFENIEL